MRVYGGACGLVAVAFVSGCGSGSAQHAYPAQAVTSFVASCIPAAIRSFHGALSNDQVRDVCRCTIEKIEASLRYKDFRRYDTRLRLGEHPVAPDGVVDAIDSCTDRFAETSTTPTS